MPFPFVAVTLPPDTPPAYVAALLEACTQAYGEGDCVSSAAASTSVPVSTGTSSNDGGATLGKGEGSAVSPPSKPFPSGIDEQRAERIMATVGWPDPLRAEIFLGLPNWLESRWIEWHLDFKEQDQLVERHRAVGFALGRLAVTVDEVAEREREARAAKPQEQPTPPAPTPPLRQPAAAETKPPVLLEPLAPPPEDADQSQSSSAHLGALLGAELGTGFRGVRIGGSAGLELVFADRFVLAARGYLTGDQFHATFAGAELRGGIVWEPEPIEVQLTVGAGWNYVSARAERTAFENVVGGVGSLSFALSKSAISPFLSAGASLLQEGIDTNVAGLSAYGPVVPRVQFGIKIRPDLL